MTRVIKNNSTTTEFINGSDKNFIYVQTTPSNLWTINHPLDKYPSVCIIDSAGSLVEGGIQYISTSRIIVMFSGGFSGRAFLN